MPRRRRGGSIGSDTDDSNDLHVDRELAPPSIATDLDLAPPPPATPRSRSTGTENTVRLNDENTTVDLPAAWSRPNNETKSTVRLNDDNNLFSPFIERVPN